MGKQVKNKDYRKVFTLLMRQTGWPEFCFPGGGQSERVLTLCMSALEVHYGEVSRERLVDFCVCQGYAMSGYGKEYFCRWKVNHSFGEKAIARFVKGNAGRRYYENGWLKEHGLSRDFLLASIGESKEHPYERFIYPEYEEHTKRRLLSSEAGYWVCGLSTLLWTPFSPACGECAFSLACQRRTQMCLAELYRIRLEAWQKNKMQV